MNVLHRLGKRFSVGSRISSINFIRMIHSTRKDWELLQNFRESNSKKR